MAMMKATTIRTLRHVNVTVNKSYMVAKFGQTSTAYGLLFYLVTVCKPLIKVFN